MCRSFFNFLLTNLAAVSVLLPSLTITIFTKEKNHCNFFTPLIFLQFINLIFYMYLCNMTGMLRFE